MAPTSGTRHVWTGLHQVPTINTTPRGSLTIRHSSKVVDYIRLEVKQNSRECISAQVDKQEEKDISQLHSYKMGNSSFNLLWWTNTILFFVAARRNVLSKKVEQVVNNPNNIVKILGKRC